MLGAAALVIGGVEQSPGPGEEGENIVQVLCSGCHRILKLATRCATCVRRYRDCCGKVKALVAESGKWNCYWCRSESLQVLEENLLNSVLQID
jgi:hypothetical protein